MLSTFEIKKAKTNKRKTKTMFLVATYLPKAFRFWSIQNFI